jgi:biopolymer transport protein ExbB/TolQ
METTKMHEFLCNSLVSGFFQSNLTGQGIVIAQLLASVIMLAYILGKYRQLSRMDSIMRRTTRSIMSGHRVLDYFLDRHEACNCPVENIYLSTSERLVKMFPPEVRNQIIARTPGTELGITSHQFSLVKSQCEYALEEESIRIEYGMGVIATVVALSPMLGLLGTVWGVLDAFAEMGAQGNATISTLAPSISAALVTTVVGLLIAIPGVAAHSNLNARIRNITSDIEKFADDLLGRIALEMQGRNQ